MSKETNMPRTFEEHIDSVSTEREGALSTAVLLQMLMWIVPLLACSFIFQILVSMNYDPLLSVAAIVSVGIPTLYGLREWQIRQTEYLKGREILILRFRLRRGKWFEDFLLVKPNGWQLLNPKKESLKSLIPTFKGNPHDLSLYMYEIAFEDCPYFDKMVLYSPCPKDQLIEMTPQLVLWKHFICGAQAAAISVVRLKEVLLGPEGIIPHVYPIDSDFEAENLLSMAGLIPITKGIVEKGTVIYEAVKYEEVLKLYEGAERERATLLELLNGMGDKAARMAAKLVEEMQEAGKMKSEKAWNLSGLIRWISKHKKLMIISLVIAVVILLVLYGGYLLPK